MLYKSLDINTYQNRVFLFVVPLAYETWAFPFRFALCHAG